MSSENDILITVENLSKNFEIYDRPISRLKQLFWGNDKRRYFRDFPALTHVSFEVRRGSSLGVIGKNGAGKSTLLQLITGTLSPTSGSVSVLGKVAAILELGAGFNPEFSGRENIKLYCNLLQISQQLIRGRLEKIIQFSELESFIDQPIKTYSSGMIARLAFSVVAHVDADILIIDEALSVGDAAFSQKCMRFLRDFRKRGTIFFVSHDISAVKAFCDEALWLDGGVVRAYGDTRSVCDAYMSSIYPNLESINKAEQSEINGDVVILHSSEEILLTGGVKKVSPTVIGSELNLLPGTEKNKEAQLIEAFSFNLDSTYFGNGKAEIISVVLTDIDGNEISYCEGQIGVVIRIRVVVREKIERPIIGFFVKDRLGQPLFGANTFLTYEDSPVTACAQQIIEAIFVFNLPTLMVGDYSITVAIADGTLQNHTQLHWMHDAVLFKVAGSTLDGVLVGIPMHNIELKVINEGDV